MIGFISILKSKKYIIVLLIFLILIPLFFLVISLAGKNLKTEEKEILLPTPFQSQTNLPSDKKQAAFLVVSTDPKNNQTGVYPGEILIRVTTDVDILSNKSFALEIKPELSYPLKFENSYPAKEIKARVIGGLLTGTTYYAALKDETERDVYKWSFTTSTKRAESSSQLELQEDEKVLDQYYPLRKYLPYESKDFNIARYKYRSKLDVTVKNPDVEKVKKEVSDWIRSHGVDPGTHTINYTNSF